MLFDEVAINQSINQWDELDDPMKLLLASIISRQLDMKEL